MIKSHAGSWNNGSSRALILGVNRITVLIFSSLATIILARSRISFSWIPEDRTNIWVWPQCISRRTPFYILSSNFVSSRSRYRYVSRRVLLQVYFIKFISTKSKRIRPITIQRFRIKVIFLRWWSNACTEHMLKAFSIPNACRSLLSCGGDFVATCATIWNFRLGESIRFRKGVKAFWFG